MVKLAKDVFGTAPDALFLHGIMASKKNVRTFAKRLSPVAVVDFRGHGESASGPPPHTMDACVEDVKSSLNFNPRRIYGHSFGGKVATSLLLDSLRSSSSSLPEEVWVLDSAPGGVNKAVRHVIETLMQAPPSLFDNSRKAVEEYFVSNALSVPEAQWVLTNMDFKSKKFKMDLDVVSSLLDDHEATRDLEVLVEIADHEDYVPNTLKFVRAEFNSTWDDETIAKMEDMGFQVHLLKNSGHWVHVDEPNKLFEILTTR